MSNARPNNETKIMIDGKEKALDADAEVKGETFTVNLNNAQGRPLLSGIITQPVSVEQRHTGIKLTGSVDDIMAALSRRSRK